jgi:dTDP-glucose 4,6-dehydratase
VRLLVCGGAGFIGSTFARQRVRDFGDDVTVLDKLTYAGRRENLDGTEHRFVHAGIEDREAVADAIAGADAVVNFAAETHVDRSIAKPDAFVTTHALGTYVLLEAARERGIRYVQVSTDEVYGSIEEGSFTETSPLNPSSPYSATKAGADLLVASYRHTFGLEALICRGSNNYGPFQYPEKLIPLMVLNALHGDKLPVYGDGMQVRNWIYAEDFARGIGFALEHGEPGEVYNVGGPDECPNLEVVQRIVEYTGAGEELIEYVTDRPGHDRRYSLSSEKIRALGWEPEVYFADGLERTVDWYRENRAWWEPIRSGDYRAYYERQYGRALGERLSACPNELICQPSAPRSSSNVAVTSSWVTRARAVEPDTVTSRTSMSVSAVSRIVACTSSTQSWPSASSDFAKSSVRIREQISSGSREALRSSMTWATSRSAPSKFPADAFWPAAAHPASAAAASRGARSSDRRRIGARG